MKFKSLVAAVLMAAATVASADCRIVTPYNPGGPGDEYSRLMQEVNPEISVLQFKPGAFAAPAINFMRDNPSYMMTASPMMWSSKNPDKAPPVELVDVILTYGTIGVTSKNVTMKDVLTKDLNVGFPNIGGPQHLIALELQKKNPKLVLVPIAGAAALTQAIVNKEVDMLIVPEKMGKGLVQDFQAKKVFDAKEQKLANYGMFAVFVHKNATVEQKSMIRECVRKVTSSSEWTSGLAKKDSQPFYGDKYQYTQEYVETLKKNGF